MAFDALKIFDAYGLRAQLFPAIIAGLPALGLLLVLVPWDRFGFPHALASVMAAVLMFAFADLARRLGRKVEARLGTRSTPELMYRRNTLVDEPLKSRYRAFFAKQLGIPAPSEEEELNEPAKASQFYNSGGAWLRERTRDTKKFKLLFIELTTYGFRRNLLGIKKLSISINIFVLLVCALALAFPLPYLTSLNDITAKLYTITLVAVVHTAYMAFGVTKAAVIEASTAYGRQLILCCESFMNPQRTTRR